MKRKNLYNDGWSYKSLDYKESSKKLPKTGAFDPVIIPHDALIHDSNELYKDCVLWYCKKLGFKPDPEKRYFLYFEGVYMDSHVFVNETEVINWPYGYTSFYAEITDLITDKDDLIYVRIDHKSPNTRWYGGPGINRNVFVYELPKTHFEIDSIYIHSERSGQFWSLNVSYGLGTVKGEGIDGYKAEATIIDQNKKTVFSSGKLPTGEIRIDNLRGIKAWDVDDPNLYVLRLSLYKDGKKIDETDQRFGFRSIEFTNDKGLFLNGKHIKLNGVCLHSDGGCIGMAFHPDMARRQIKTVLDMGANAIRFAHNPPAPEFLDLCDEYGILVMDEAFDCWRGGKTEYDYGRFFDDHHKKDMESFVRRDRNHPCVIMWSIGNEIYDTHKDAKEGIKTMRSLMDVVDRFDPYKNARATLCSNYMPWENTQKAADVIKLIGYNYAERFYEEHHKKHPDWIIYGSETMSVVQSRGVYHFPLESKPLSDEDLQCSSLGNSVTSWGAKDHDFCITTERDTEFSLGQFLWTGIDYMGEPTPYHTKNSYFGLADTACFPKDAYFLYKSEWMRKKGEHLVHVLPYWDFNEGQMIDVRICSTESVVELIVNGKSFGKKTIDHEKGTSLYADYRVPYKNGYIKAVAYDDKGKAVCEDVEHSFSDTASLKLSSSEFTVKEGEDTLYFVEITAFDNDGYEVKNASDRVNIKVTGPGYLYGLDNGDSSDYESFKASSRRLFNGKALAVIRTTGRKGTIKVNAAIDKKDITVRKIELSCDAKKNKDQRSLITNKDGSCFVRAGIYPEGAGFDDIEFKITNETGIEIKTAYVKPDKKAGGVYVYPVSDGDFKLRAVGHDRSKKVVCISALEFTSEGFGRAYFDPYTFVYGSLYSKMDGDVGNGNENGACTDASLDSWIAFCDVDFKGGSDTVSIPLFELSSEPLNVRFWDGIPHDKGSSLIGDFTYDKPSIWNVYQSETYKLDKVLKGIRTLGIEIIKHKTHIKGFEFKKMSAKELVYRASDADEIYGDTYTVKKDAVYGIGNNVSLKFTDLDLTKDGTDSITIKGHTSMDNNSIHILFEGEGNSSHQIVEFKGSKDMCERTFKLEKVEGINDVTFLFLPGCDFDLSSFSFN